MMIDFHVHCFQDTIASKAVPALAKEANIKAHLNGTIKDLKKSMGIANIDYSVIQPIATKPTQNRIINEWAASINQEDGIISFGTLHPNTVEWKQEIDYISSNGLKGIKFHPDYQLFFVDEQRMLPIYEYLFNAGLIVLFHAGLDIGLPAPYHCTPDRLINVIKLFPESKMIAAHMGGFKYWGQVEDYLVGENVYFDTSYSFDELGKEGFLRLISLHGIDRFLFATDSPWADQYQEVKNIHSLDLTKTEKDKIFFGNAKKLLQL